MEEAVASFLGVLFFFVPLFLSGLCGYIFFRLSVYVWGLCLEKFGTVPFSGAFVIAVFIFMIPTIVSSYLVFVVFVGGTISVALMNY